MLILANENIPGAAVEALRQRGHDVAWAREDSPGESDLHLLDRAQGERRILLTFDKDFGELAFRLGQSAIEGVVLLRISTPSSARVAEVIVAALEGRVDWPGHFSVIEDDRIRMTPLPGAKQATG